MGILVFKAPGTGEEHGNIKFITSVDHFLVPNRASGLHDNLYSGIFDGINAVPEGKEGVRSQHATFHIFAPFSERHMDGIHAAYLSGAKPHSGMIFRN